MRRREFIALVGGAVAAMPVAARAQRSGTAVVGVLSPEGPTTGNVNGLVEGLRERGYFDGRNIRFDTDGPRESSTDCQDWRPI